jgi:hypothetical protein
MQRRIYNLQFQCSNEERREGNDVLIGASYSILDQKKMYRMEQGESSETWEIYIVYFWVIKI